MLQMPMAPGRFVALVVVVVDVVVVVIQWSFALWSCFVAARLPPSPQVARKHDPRLNSALLAHKSAGISADDGLKYHVKELLIGAEIAGQYRVDAYIASGTYGHGWRAIDLQSHHEVRRQLIT